MATQVAKKEANDLALLPADMAADADLGGKVGLGDISIPFVSILQGLSPQVQPDHPKYIKGALQGMLYVSVVNKIAEGRTGGLKVVPCYYERQLVEWKDINAGGGLVKSYPAGDPIQATVVFNDKNQPMLPNGNQLYDTAYWYVLVELDGNWTQAVFPMKSTMLKVSKKWNTELMTTYIPGMTPPTKAPSWLYAWTVTTIKQQKGPSVMWSIPVITKGEQVTRSLYDMAKQYARIAADGILRGAVAAGEQSNEGGQRKLDDAEIPF